MDNQRSLTDIAEEIILDWNPPHYSAIPYLNAMRTMDSIDDRYGADGTAMVACYQYDEQIPRQHTGTSIVVYFLCNASSWSGQTARRIKKELRDMLAAAAARKSGPRYL